ncbi:putative HTH CENPB-type domain-containing protein [Phytophthora infestans]|uniref:Putative HTH CENPB-type domain-containing protein n=1 Tax=Phytophthora infestans TaxID=4787 RepID=A0A8S9TUT7_PHYIN|nr:putative HTH CENPB-type domain-containing protein [Phytophthora infestans]
MAMRAWTRQDQMRPEDADTALKAFNVKAKQRMVKLGVDVVYNAGQTPVFFEHQPKSTIIAKGSHIVWVRSTGKDKETVTCMLCGESLGRKYPLYIIVKTKPSKAPVTRSENDRKMHQYLRLLWKTVKPLQAQHNIFICGNPDGWWNEGLTVNFLPFHFGGRANMEVPVLLLLHEFSGYWTDAV